MSENPMKDYIQQQLKDMGFPENKIGKALKANNTENVNLEQVMEWIIAHEGDPEDPPNDPDQERLVLKGPAQEAADSGEGGEKKEEKVKTAEEVEAEKKKYEERIKQRRLEREEKEKQEEIEREKSRRKTGGEIVRIKEKMENEERIRAAQEMRRDKIETEIRKQQVLEQIRADREAQRKPTAAATATVTPPAAPQARQACNSCRLAIRLPNGSTLQNDFNSKEQLAAVRLYVELNRKDEGKGLPFNLLLPPNSVFTDEDMERSLLDLGLCPSARLVLSQKKIV